MLNRALAIAPETHRCHSLHSDERDWAETNCYVDIWIELLHALGCDPHAALPFTFTIDFEGDQWTFFKFPLGDLRDLYGIDVQELQLWRPLTFHLDEQIARGRPVLVELDSHYLPDTEGTVYHRAHVKTTVAAVEIDSERGHLGYLHGRGLYCLSGDDFLDALRVREPASPSSLPPYAEIVKVPARRGADARDYVDISLELLKRHLRFAPIANPVIAFRGRLETDLRRLREADLDAFHQYAFATLRQYGACFELGATYLRWLASHGTPVADAESFQSLSQKAKAFQFQLARALARGTPLDLSPLDDMACRWEQGMSALRNSDIVN